MCSKHWLVLSHELSNSFQSRAFESNWSLFSQRNHTCWVMHESTCVLAPGALQIVCMTQQLLHHHSDLISLLWVHTTVLSNANWQTETVSSEPLESALKLDVHKAKMPHVLASWLKTQTFFSSLLTPSFSRVFWQWLRENKKCNFPLAWESRDFLAWLVQQWGPWCHPCVIALNFLALVHALQLRQTSFLEKHRSRDLPFLVFPKCSLFNWGNSECCCVLVKFRGLVPVPNLVATQQTNHILASLPWFLSLVLESRVQVRVFCDLINTWDGRWRWVAWWKPESIGRWCCTLTWSDLDPCAQQ